jgi:hypothetical protein
MKRHAFPHGGALILEAAGECPDDLGRVRLCVQALLRVKQCSKKLCSAHLERKSDSTYIWHISDMRIIVGNPCANGLLA